MRNERIKAEVPIWEKANLTIEEAAEYTSVGICKLRELTNDESCEFVIWIGNRRLIKRKKLDKFLENLYAI